MMEASSISFQFLVQDLMLQFLPQAFVPSFFMQDADADTASVAASADGRCFLSSSKGLEFFFLDGDRRPPVLAIESDASFSLLVLSEF